ncbi:hypothetical protein CW304_07670 [Bacillus sp. UFRGS-B20]|nr:hypothetical protein CW304_07670 [Bacillus sp. UFRGS-B20]
MHAFHIIAHPIFPLFANSFHKFYKYIRLYLTIITSLWRFIDGDNQNHINPKPFEVNLAFAQ